MNYLYINNLNDIPDWLDTGKLAVFLNSVMKPYEDTIPDIERGLTYALSDDIGRGGFIILALEGEQLNGAVVILNTGMSGYVPAHLLLFIAVSPELRNHGIGAHLIEMAKEHCEGSIKLHVEPDNPALHLYERQGFHNKYLEMRFQKHE